MIGTTLGSYTIERELGHGGMGAVYVGVHQLLGRRAAIKVLLPKYTSNDEVVQRFFTEAKAASAIKHPSIVEIYDYGVAADRDGAAYIVMELCDGESLAARLRRARPVALSFALAIARQIAVALGAAHAAGIVHRDLKPDNVFVVRDPEVVGGERIKLLDFGIAKLAQGGDGGGAGAGVTESGAILGTPTYMAPEQCRGAGAVDHRADLYALGCILYEMVCGRVPFVGEGSGDVIGAHLLVAPRPPRELVPALPAGVEAVILELLAKSPDERYASADEVARALDRVAATTAPAPAVAYASTVASGETVATGGGSSGSGAAAAPSVRPARRRVAMTGVAALAGGVALGVAAFAVQDRGAERGPPPAAAHAHAALPPEAAAHARVLPAYDDDAAELRLAVAVDGVAPVPLEDVVLADRAAGDRWERPRATSDDTEPAAVVLVVDGSELWMGNEDDTPKDSPDWLPGAFHDVVSALDADRDAWPPATELAVVTYGDHAEVRRALGAASTVGGSALGAQRIYHDQRTQDLAGALDLALDVVEHARAARKAIIVIGDGNDTDNELAKPRLIATARLAASAHVSLRSIVVPTTLHEPADALLAIQPAPLALHDAVELPGALRHVIDGWAAQRFVVQFAGRAFDWDGAQHDLALRIGDRELPVDPIALPAWAPPRRAGAATLALALAGLASIGFGVLALRRRYST